MKKIFASAASATMVMMLAFTGYIGAAEPTSSWDSQSSSVFDPVVFDWQFYLDANSDLRSAGLNSVTQAQNHWQSFGQAECRRASASFSARDYLELNPDLAGAFGSANCKAGVAHYLSKGRFENRQKTKSYAYGWQVGAAASTAFGNATFGNEKITIRTSAVYAGTVTQLWFRGKQFVNSHDTGRLIQTAFTFENLGECFNPTEAGAAADVRLVNGVPTGKSQSQLRTLALGAGSLTAQTSPAYWYSPGMSPAPYCGTPQGASGTSPDTITKTVSMNHGGDSQIVRWQVDVNVATDHSAMSLEALTGYLNGEFDSFYLYDPGLQSLVKSAPATLSVVNGTPTFVGDPTHFFPTVLSTTDGRHAMGVIALDQELSTPDRNTRVATNYQISALNPNDAADSTTKWSVGFHYVNVKKGKYSTTLYLILGNLTEVTQRMKTLYQHNPNQFVNLLATSNGKAAFDLNYYLLKYADVRNAYAGGFDKSLEHYLLSGMREGRNGSSVYNAKNYMNGNVDVAAAYGANNFIDSTKHWILFGKPEGRSGLPAP